MVVITLAAVGPIRNYDLFWHLATGRWITEHRALPTTDPFAVASDRVPWINGEWLFEVVLYGFERLVGITGLSWIRALFIGGLFAIVYRLARPNALLATSLAFAGAMATIDLRPSGIAALFVVLAIDTVCANRRHAPIVFAILTILWINVHPSALLAPILALLIRPRSWFPLIAAGALLVNPHGIHGVIAPLKLMTFVQSGAFVNAEWLPSSPRLFPLLYISLLWSAAALAAAFLRRGKAAAGHIWRIPLLLLFAYLAIRHVRHQPLWFAAFPLLIAPVTPKPPRVFTYAASIALIAWIAIRTDHRRGVSPSRFPIEAVARLKETNLRGNIYNPDQFGGFLIWAFYPERRTLTDGRNELYHQFIPEYAKARGDQRAWRALLRKYRIDLAVDERRAPLEVIDGVTGKKSTMSASLAYWPPKDWAMIAQDRAAMAFARRAAFSREEIERWEIARSLDFARDDTP